jgi:hypothetical protein
LRSRGIRVHGRASRCGAVAQEFAQVKRVAELGKCRWVPNERWQEFVSGQPPGPSQRSLFLGLERQFWLRHSRSRLLVVGRPEETGRSRTRFVERR